MLHRLKTAPSVEPVTLAEMRTHLGISQPGETSRDAIITERIAAAADIVESITQLALITQTWVAYGDSFSCGAIAVKKPVQSITSITYLDSAGVRQTLANTEYELDSVSAVIVPAYGKVWPSCRVFANSVQVEYVCGYGSAASSVPVGIKEAIKFIVAQWEMFQSTIEGGLRPLTIPAAAYQLLNPYKDYRGCFGEPS